MAKTLAILGLVLAAMVPSPGHAATGTRDLTYRVRAGKGGERVTVRVNGVRIGSIGMKRTGVGVESALYRQDGTRERSATWVAHGPKDDPTRKSAFVRPNGWVPGTELVVDAPGERLYVTFFHHRDLRIMREVRGGAGAGNASTMTTVYPGPPHPAGAAPKAR